ncbi:amino acid ABC transporter substrate-binding protein [Helicobacter jaachi]|uniref:Amino acid ABC transporter substrate-binding protein n=2 Tax=Helicobacter jaachi TaxID=1677920 RepID=A0A4U8TBE9_9HELI|nr:amino acid ABC transporter substrate-binding protein [Helicobacter jaachi]
MRAKILSLILCSLFMLNACSDDELVVATAANFMPFEYVEGKEFRGIDMDIAKVIADKLHKKLVIKDMEFDSVVTALASHNADIAISGLTINQTRAKVIDFSDTYFNASQMVIIESSDERFAHIHDKEQLLETLRAIPNLKIGVQAGTTAQFYVSGDKDWGFEGLANAEVKGFSNGALATIAMKNHQVDIVMIDEMPARAIVAASEGVSLLEIPLTNEQYAIGVAKGENELKNQINAILQSMKDDGTMENIIKKHYAQGAN